MIDQELRRRAVMEGLHFLIHELARTTNKLARLVEDVRVTLFFPFSAQLRIETQEGFFMNLTVLLTDNPGKAIFTEFAADGVTKVPPTTPPAFSLDTPSVATVDAASGQLTYVGAGTAIISAVDNENGLSASATLTVQSAAKAVSATLDLVAGTPTPTQTPTTTLPPLPK
jgi:hypothetical protein